MQLSVESVPTNNTCNVYPLLSTPDLPSSACMDVTFHALDRL